MPTPTNSDQLHGTIDMLVLKVLEDGPLHGYAIAVRLERMSNDVLSVEEGSLYPALHRMEESGWIKARWKTTENKRRARVYEITPAGRRRLDEDEQRWRTVAGAVALVLKKA